MSSPSSYYIPHEAKWPVLGSVALFVFFMGFAQLLNGGHWLFMAVGAALLVFMMVGWFGDVISESENGTYSPKVDVSFRMAMMWFIFSEVMFFGAFFGALFYARTFSGPWLSGLGRAVLRLPTQYCGQALITCGHIMVLIILVVIMTRCIGFHCHLSTRHCF